MRREPLMCRTSTLNCFYCATQRSCIVHSCMFVFVYIHVIYTDAHIHTHTHTYTHIHTYIHIHMHMHTHTRTNDGTPIFTPCSSCENVFSRVICVVIFTPMSTYTHTRVRFFDIHVPALNSIESLRTLSSLKAFQRAYSLHTCHTHTHAHTHTHTHTERDLT